MSINYSIIAPTALVDALIYLGCQKGEKVSESFMKKKTAKSVARNAQRARLGSIRREQSQDKNACVLVNRPIKRSIHLLAPAIFSFNENGKEVVEFLKEVRHYSNYPVWDRDRLIVDLSPIRRLELSGALALVAEFDRWQRVADTKLEPLTISGWDQEVVNYLFALGFFKLLKTKIIHKPQPSTDVIWIPFMSGTSAMGQAARTLRLRIERHLGGPVGIHMEIYASLVESMKNALQHAYAAMPGERDRDTVTSARVGKRWWMTGMVNRVTRELKVVFLDQGITIPVSLPTSYMWPKIHERLQDADTDALRLVSAMRYGASRMGESHRGKGFRDIRHLALLDPRNTLRIMSRRAIYSLNGGFGVAADSSVPFAGTMLEWHLHIPEPF